MYLCPPLSIGGFLKTNNITLHWSIHNSTTAFSSTIKIWNIDLRSQMIWRAVFSLPSTWFKSAPRAMKSFAIRKNLLSIANISSDLAYFGVSCNFAPWERRDWILLSIVSWFPCSYFAIASLNKDFPIPLSMDSKGIPCSKNTKHWSTTFKNI